VGPLCVQREKKNCRPIAKGGVLDRKHPFTSGRYATSQRATHRGRGQETTSELLPNVALRQADRYDEMKVDLAQREKRKRKAGGEKKGREGR